MRINRQIKTHSALITIKPLGIEPVGLIRHQSKTQKNENLVKSHQNWISMMSMSVKLVFIVVDGVKLSTFPPHLGEDSKEQPQMRLLAHALNTVRGNF